MQPLPLAASGLQANLDLYSRAVGYRYRTVRVTGFFFLLSSPLQRASSDASDHLLAAHVVVERLHVQYLVYGFQEMLPPILSPFLSLSPAAPLFSPLPPLFTRSALSSSAV